MKNFKKTNGKLLFSHCWTSLLMTAKRAEGYSQMGKG